jgi:hypothetical protein
MTIKLPPAFQPKQQQQPQPQDPVREPEQPQPIAKPVTQIESQPEQPISQLNDEIQANLTKLKSKIDSKIPDVKTELMIIHKAIASDPAQVTILSELEMSLLFQSYSKLSGIELVAVAATKKSSSKKSYEDFV